MSIPVAVIMNPAARSAKAGQGLERIKGLHPAPEMHYTSYAGHAVEIAANLAAEGREIVVAAGGDGTVNEVLQGLGRVNSQQPDARLHTALGVLPSGTMNVFAYEVGFPSHRDWTTPWSVIHSKQRREIDLWQANDHYFLQLAGIGLDAEVVQGLPWELKKKYGPLSYIIVGLQMLNQPAPILTVRVSDRPELLGRQVLCGNGRNYGGRFPVFPAAKQADGLLDVLILREPINLWQGLQLLCGTLSGRAYSEAEDIDYLQTDRLTIDSETRTAVQIDGEFCGHTPLHISKAPFPLRIAAA